MLLTQKYAPKKLEEVLGNSEKIDYIRQWILQWMSGKARKPLLVWGPPGVGKTSVAYALTEQYNLDIIEMNASELRNRDRVERVLGNSSLAGSLFGGMRLILIDDADVLAGRKDSGGGTAIKSFLSESFCPAIVTATNAWEKDLAPIRSECELVELKRINKLTVKKHLDQVSKSEKISLGAEKIDAIAERAHGDLRAALNDLQSLGPSDRFHEKDVFEIVRGVLKANTYSEAKEAAGGNIDYDFLKLWIDENIPFEYERPHEIAAAYDSLSKADVFDGRIKKQNWSLLKYSIDLATAGVAIAKDAPYRKFTKYNFPSWLRSMSQSAERRGILKAIGSKIGRKVHANRRDALEYLPLLKESGKKHQQEIMDFYEFSEEEVAFILETSVTKVKKG
jgi:replication factor C large subunit